MLIGYSHGPLLCLCLAVALDFAAGGARGVVRVGPELSAGSGRVLSQSNITFLLEDLYLDDGVLFAFSAYFLSSDPVRLQIWRPESVVHRKYVLIWEERVVANEKGVKIVYIKDLPMTNCLAVQKGDRVGMFAENGPVPIAYVFVEQGVPSTLRHPLGTPDHSVAIGQSVSFDALTFPYQYSVNAYIDTDRSRYSNPPRVFCANITIEEEHSSTTTQKKTTEPRTIPLTPDGATSHTGPRGPPGEIGPHGFEFPQPKGVVPECICREDGSLTHNHTILGIFIWLTAITIINLSYIGYSCFRVLQKGTSTTTSSAIQTQAIGIPPHQNDQNMYVEKVRETVREYNSNATGTNVQALAALNADVKI